MSPRALSSPSPDTLLTDQSRAHAPGIHRRSHGADAGPKTPQLALWRSSRPTPGVDELGKEKTSTPRSGRTRQSNLSGVPDLQAEGHTVVVGVRGKPGREPIGPSAARA